MTWDEHGGNSLATMKEVFAGSSDLPDADSIRREAARRLREYPPQVNRCIEKPPLPKGRGPRGKKRRHTMKAEDFKLLGVYLKQNHLQQLILKFLGICFFCGRRCDTSTKNHSPLTPCIDSLLQSVITDGIRAWPRPVSFKDKVLACSQCHAARHKNNHNATMNPPTNVLHDEPDPATTPEDILELIDPIEDTDPRTCRTKNGKRI